MDELQKINDAAHADCLAIYEHLAARGETLGFAESCTGGGVCAAMAKIPGVSSVLRGGVVAYDPAVKHRLLGVPHYFLDEVGIVSRETALSMAAGVSRLLDADWGIATTGYAGPGGGDLRYGVGTVCFAVFCRKNPAWTWTVARHFDGNRIIVVAKAAHFVLHGASVVIDTGI